MKLFARHQDIQSRLRSELRAAFATAYAEGRVPSAKEIISTQCHYLDACIEDAIRESKTTIMVSRTAAIDATVLGAVIPKGAKVLFPVTGGGLMEPEFPIDPKLRTETFRKANGGKQESWDHKGMKGFNPDRWMHRDPETGNMVYNSLAGPNPNFGGGARGCYGRKMAYMELRMAFCLIIWSFELGSVPEQYSSWEASDMLTHCPVMTYIQPTKI